jgi:hypothetical protein
LGNISLRSFERVQFEGVLFYLFLHVGGEIAGPLCPFDRRLAIGLAVGTRLISHHTVTSLAGFHDGIASPAVVGTAILLHEDAFRSYLDSLTNHDNQPPFFMDLFCNLLKLLIITISKKGIKKRATEKVTHFGKNQNEWTIFNIVHAICQAKFSPSFRKYSCSPDCTDSRKKISRIF